MSIVSLIPYYVGQVDQGITRWKLICTNTLAEVTANGFLNIGNLMGYTIAPTDIFDAVYAYTGSINLPGAGTYIELLPTITFLNGISVITLNPVVSSANIPLPTLPVVSGNIVEFTGINGAVADSGIAASNTVTKNSVNAMATGSGITLFKGAGTATGNAITLNQSAGFITSVALTTAAGSSQAITLTNSLITASSNVTPYWGGGTNTNANFTLSSTSGVGSSVITIFNNAPTAALNGTIIIGFTVQ